MDVTDCANWTGNIDPISGYGRYSQKRAHRLAWEQARGPIPGGLHVLHRCDNRRCVNVDHLFLGTNADNMADKKSKGRAPRGERHWKSKLTEDLVRKIRAEAASGERAASIARRFGLNRETVVAVVRRTTWGHVE